ncbi:MAG: heme ABC exporter ATP-binding protein CcmA [Chloroflexota bacterium]|nr:heme ABC exporter ATP-binding protein CcmA [Dehalococcoidia bacterium]MDW8253335.1 heme ABC exporter ATP-binding protein CcmA [Chloroflexota bacterium]
MTIPHAALPTADVQVRPPAIEVRGLRKEIGGRLILRGIDLRVEMGETVVIFGPNGAGKTTLLRILATLARPSSGMVRIGGVDLHEVGPAIRRWIGLLAHQTYLYDDLTAEENLRFYGRMFDIPDLDRRIDVVLEQVGLSERRGDRVRVLSRGMQQRLALARAILHRPGLLLLDEPESGLDPTAAAGLRSLLAAVEQPDRAVLLTSHSLDLGLDLASRVVLLVRGTIVLDTPRAAIDRAALEQFYARAVMGGAAP